MAAYPKILVVTRGDYITRKVLQGLFNERECYDLRVVIVTGDSKGQTGLPMLRAL